MKYLIVYLVIINLITFIMFAIDKYKAKNIKWRIKERTLLLFSLFGGAFGGLIAMYSIRHKTKTPIFMFCVPLSLILHMALIFLGIYKGWIVF